MVRLTLMMRSYALADSRLLALMGAKGVEFTSQEFHGCINLKEVKHYRIIYFDSCDKTVF